MTTYTIEKVNCVDDELLKFLQEEVPKISEMFDSKFNYENCDLEHMVKNGVFLVCKKDNFLTGFHLSWLMSSPLDVTVKILTQQLFYVKPDSGRTAYHLFKKFIDFGQTHADHINTMIGRHTNIKASTLKRWGFEELEVMYRMEVIK